MANGYNMRNIAEVVLLVGVSWALQDQGRSWTGTCVSGNRQSPIDLGETQGIGEEQLTVSPFNSSYAPLSLHYPPLDSTYASHQAASTYLLTHLQGGFTAVPIGSAASVRYQLERVEFRTPAEHRLGGRRYELEMQMIHRGEDGSKAGLAVWYERSERKSSVLEAVIQDTPLSFFSELGPQFSDFHFYSGSQTVPPCSEDITWYLLGSKPASASQIQFFTQMWPGAGNAREAQSTNGRWFYHMIPGEQGKFLQDEKQ